MCFYKHKLKEKRWMVEVFEDKRRERDGNTQAGLWEWSHAVYIRHGSR